MRSALKGRDWRKCQSSNILSVLDESGRDVAECRRKMASGRKVAGFIRFLVILEVCSLSLQGY